MMVSCVCACVCVQCKLHWVSTSADISGCACIDRLLVCYTCCVCFAGITNGAGWYPIYGSMQDWCGGDSVTHGCHHCWRP